MNVIARLEYELAYYDPAVHRLTITPRGQPPNTKVVYCKLLDHFSHRIPECSATMNLYLPTPPLGQNMTQGQFLTGVYQVWIQTFPSPRLVASPRMKNTVCPTLTHSGRENNWIHTFPKGISAMWNAISLVQCLNSCNRVHFLRRKPLHHSHQEPVHKHYGCQLTANKWPHWGLSYPSKGLLSTNTFDVNR